MEFESLFTLWVAPICSMFIALFAWLQVNQFITPQELTLIIWIGLTSFQSLGALLCSVQTILRFRKNYQQGVYNLSMHTIIITACNVYWVSSALLLSTFVTRYIKHGEYDPDIPIQELALQNVLHSQFHVAIVAQVVFVCELFAEYCNDSTGLQTATFNQQQQQQQQELPTISSKVDSIYSTTTTTSRRAGGPGRRTRSRTTTITPPSQEQLLHSNPGEEQEEEEEDTEEEDTE